MGACLHFQHALGKHLFLVIWLSMGSSYFARGTRLVVPPVEAGLSKNLAFEGFEFSEGSRPLLLHR